MFRAVCAAALCVAAISSAFAQGYPNKPIRLLVGYAPGGSAEAGARPLARVLEPLLGQPLIFEYRPGNAGGVAMEFMCCRNTKMECAVAYYGTYIEHNIREAKNLHRPFMLHMAMKDRWVQAEVNELLERRLAPNPLVTIRKYPGADHAFARHGGRTYSKPEADRALELSVAFFRRHL